MFRAGRCTSALRLAFRRSVHGLDKPGLTQRRIEREAHG